MTHEAKTVVIVDPRTFDGDPFDVADRACQQASGLVQHLRTALEGARLMARNAELERQLQAGVDLDPVGWENGPQGERFQRSLDELSDVEHSVNVLRRAAMYNPKNPPKDL